MIFFIVVFEVLLLYLFLGVVGIVVIFFVVLVFVIMYLMVNRGGVNSGFILLDESEMKWFYEGIVEMLKKVGIKVLVVYFQDDYIFNVYFFGGNIVFLLGFFEVLDEDEILVVVVYEFGYIKNGDIKLFLMVMYGWYLMFIMIILLMIGGNFVVRIIVFLLYIFYEVLRISFMKKREFMVDDIVLRLLFILMSFKRVFEEMKYYEDLRVDVKINVLLSIEFSIERD